MRALFATTALLSFASVVKSLPVQSGNGTKCGLPAIQPDLIRIVGGKDAVPYSWPWQVALMMSSEWAETYQFCAGSIISREWVITAGHCFYGYYDIGSYTVRMGVYNKNKVTEEGEIEMNITEIHVHPKYDSQSTRFDITLLKLEKPINFTDHISPVCLPYVLDEPLPDPGTPVWITGWGATAEFGGGSDTLKQVVVPIANITVCKKRYKDLGGPEVYEKTMFCAGLDEGGKDSCQGDSGGPAVYKDPESGRWKQLGITSWGYGCGEKWLYGVYSKVSAYVDFISQYVSDL